MKHVIEKIKAPFMSRINKERVVFLSIILFLSALFVGEFYTFSGEKREFNAALRMETTKSGKLQAEKDILVLSKEDLETQNKALSDELKDQKGQVIYITQVETRIVTDTQYLTNTLVEYPDGAFGLRWGYDTTFSPGNSRALEGVSKFKINELGVFPLTTEVTKDEFGINIITGIKEREKQIEIFVRSDYPGFKVSSIEGAVIDPHKSEVLKSYFPPKKWGLGPQVGATMTREGRVSPYIGLGLSYNLIRF
jgi:hypothetical protein